MGIRNLNVFLRENCTTKSINKIKISDLSYKTLVIDTSIYLYKYLEKNALMENMFKMIYLFKKYNINPIFVFDGKSPLEKQEKIMQRRIQRNIDVDENETGQTNQTTNTNGENGEIREKNIKLQEEHIQMAKEIMDAYGVVYYDAINESDQFCVFLVNHMNIWGCVSDDMDMFVYGCNRVIRHLSLNTQTAILYETNNILQELQMNICDFRKMVILQGTDYEYVPDQNTIDITDIIFGKVNVQSYIKINIYDSWKYYQEYRKEKWYISCFYQWLLEKNIISEFDKMKLEYNYNMFVLDKYYYVYKELYYKKKKEYPILWGKLKTIRNKVHHQKKIVLQNGCNKRPNIIFSSGMC